MATLSILGMYNFDNSIFDGFRTPENVDKEDTINNILLECAELEIIYPEINTLKLAIKMWTNKEFQIWEELQKTREYEYNPIWNKDGIIRETESRETAGNESTTKNETGETTQSGETIQRGTQSTTRELDGIENVDEDTTGLAENSIFGYNSTEWAKKDKTETTTNTDIERTRDENETITGTSTNNQNDSISIENNTTGSEDKTKEENENITRERVEQGNIGVTTTQKMIQEQRDIVVFNTMEYIIQSFKKRFCILVY